MRGKFCIRGGKLAERVARRMNSETIGDRRMDPLTAPLQSVADAFAGREAVLMGMLQQGFGRLTRRLGQTRDVEQSVEYGKVGEQIFANILSSRTRRRRAAQAESNRGADGASGRLVTKRKDAR